MMPSWSADAQKFWAYDSLSRIKEEKEEEESNAEQKLTSESLRPVNELCKFLHFNTEF